MAIVPPHGSWKLKSRLAQEVLVAATASEGSYSWRGVDLGSQIDAPWVGDKVIGRYEETKDSYAERMLHGT
jgi:hypothetical protein